MRFFGGYVTNEQGGRHMTKDTIMKTHYTIYLAAGILLISNPIIGQTDTTRLQVGNTKVIVVQDNPPASEQEPEEDKNPIQELTNWAGIDVGFNMLVGKNRSLDLGQENEWLDLQHERSLSWRINFFEQKIKLAGDYVGLLTGAGLTYNSYGFRNEVTVISNTKAFPDTTFGVIDTIQQFSKSKLRATYVHVPLLLEFNTNMDPKRNFHIACGVIGGWKIGSIAKQHFESDGGNYRVRNQRDFNLTPFTLDLTARVGYKQFTLFATYGLTPLFRSGKGPEVYPVTVGLNVVPW